MQPTHTRPLHQSSSRESLPRINASTLVGLACSLLVWLTPPPASAAGVRHGKQEVHPTRILARLASAPQVQAGPGLAGTLSPLGLEVRRQYSSVPGLVLLDEPGVPALAADFPADQLESRRTKLLVRMAALRATGLFAYVEPDFQVRVNTEPTDSAFVDGTLWGLRNIGANGGTPGADISATNAWDITTGDTNVVVAVIDTGINYNHLDLAAQMWRNPDEIADNGVDDDFNGYVDDVFGINAITGSGNPLDDHDHGSHCSGTIGAAANNGSPHVGVAWQVRLMGLKFLSSGGSGNTSDAVECVNYAVNKRAKILSNSWGGGGFSQALLDAILAANAADILFVAAAGNDGRNTDTTPTYPAGYEADNVISVAALTRTDALAGFSNYGAQSVDLGAPGVDIYSSISGPNNAYDTFSGTSMACPHVAGVSALLAAQFTTNITVAELRQRLFESTTPIPALSGRSVTGGRVNAYQALTVTEDGTLDVRVSFDGGLPLRAGSTTAVHFVVTDLVPVTTATVTAEVVSEGPLSVVNDGNPPDAVAGDHVYSGSVVVPLSGNQVVIEYVASAPGKTAYTGSITAAILVPPPNDHFASRIPLTGSSNRVTATNLGASAELGEPGHIGTSAFRSVWWTWTAPVSDTVTVDTIGSSFDTTLAVYTGNAVENLTRVANDDDSGGTLTSRLSFPATAGTTYQIAVDGYSGATGDIMLKVFEPAPAEPVIVEQPADQYSLVGGTVTFRVQASGAPALSYQWYRDGSELPDATTSSLSINPVGAGDVAQYQAVVSNHLGTTTSREAQLTLITIGNGFFDDFEPTLDAPQWSAFSGQVEANANGGSVSGANSLWFNGNASRSATTRPLNVQYGGEVAFWLRFGTTPNAPWEIPELPGEGVVVEYSVDGGATFVPLATYDTPVFLSWTRCSVALPAAAYGPDTLVRWRQLANSGDNADHWALDDVAVTLYATPQPVVFLTQPAGRTVEAGTTVSFAPVVGGSEPISYRWFKDGDSLAGETGVQLVLPQVTTNVAGAYTLVASNLLGAVSSSDAVLTVIPILTVCEAVDNCDLIWNSGGTTNWTGQTVNSYDGEDAAQSGVISHSQDSWIETTVAGPGTLNFWWSVSSEADFDYLELRTNGVLVTRISGAVDWTAVSQTVAPGPQTVRLRYMKDGSVNTGQDRAWVDQVSFVQDGPEPVIVSQPQSITVITGEPAAFTVGASGALPLHYQWWRDGAEISGATLSSFSLGNCQLADSGSAFHCVVTNADGMAASSAATLTVVPGVTLCDAVDDCSLTWSQGGAAPWTGQVLTTYDGQDAAESGLITHSQDSWFETTVDGPGTVSFWWSVSSEGSYDYLEFYVGGTLATRISGSVDWSLVTQPLTSGPQTVRWRYMKDGSVNTGQDRGWVDQISYVPDAPEPVITSQPQDRTVGSGGSATFTVGISGRNPLSYSWSRGGTPIPGATQPSYTLANCQLADSGSQFRCVVTNDYGAVTSTVATLTVTPEQVFTFHAPDPITVPSSGPASPYPSIIEVSGINGTLLRIAATLNGINHTWPDDLDILLVGPSGQAVMLMSDAGGSVDLVDISLTFDPGAVNLLPEAAQILSGTYLPTDFDTGEVMDAPAPGGPYGTDLGAFAGNSPNGTWSLFVLDDAPGDTGNLSGGWSLRLTVGADAPPVLLPPYMQNGQMHVSFPTQPGRTYTVKWTDTLSIGAWHTLDSVEGDGSTHTLADPATGQPQRYYQLLME
jgi:subtilisin family serine protease